jgi:hypothetical protein
MADIPARRRVARCGWHVMGAKDRSALRRAFDQLVLPVQCCRYPRILVRAADAASSGKIERSAKPTKEIATMKKSRTETDDGPAL